MYYALCTDVMFMMYAQTSSIVLGKFVMNKAVGAASGVCATI